MQYNNGPVIEQQNFSNVFSLYKAQTTWSQDDLTTLGPTCGYVPDKEDSWVYSTFQLSLHLVAGVATPARRRMHLDPRRDWRQARPDEQTAPCSSAKSTPISQQLEEPAWTV